MLKEVAEDDVRFSGTEASLREDPRSKSVLLLSVSGTASAREPRDYHQSCSAPCCDGCGVCIRQRWGLTRRYTHSSATSRAPQARRDRTSQLLPDAFTLPPHLHPVHPTPHHAHPALTHPLPKAGGLGGLGRAGGRLADNLKAICQRETRSYRLFATSGLGSHLAALLAPLAADKTSRARPTSTGRASPGWHCVRLLGTVVMCCTTLYFVQLYCSCSVKQFYTFVSFHFIVYFRFYELYIVQKRPIWESHCSITSKSRLLL